MSAYNDTTTRNLPASGALGQYLRVKENSSGQAALAGANDAEFGVTEKAVFTANEPTPIRMRTAQGTYKMVANGAVTAGATVYGAASGKVSATAGTVVIGTAVNAAGADGDIIEVLRDPQSVRVVAGQATTVTASDTIATGLSMLISVVATEDSDPIDDPEWVSASIGDQAGSPAAGSFLLKTWKNTSGTDPTPVAASTFGKKVNWLAYGY